MPARNLSTVKEEEEEEITRSDRTELFKNGTYDMIVLHGIMYN